MDKRPLIIFGIAAIFILILFIIFGKNNERYNWQETYKENSKAPYGGFLIYELLKDYYPDVNFTPIDKNIASNLPTNTTASSNYIFIGEALLLDTASISQVLNFVKQGNKAFISAKALPFRLMFDLYYEECFEQEWNSYKSLSDSAVSMNLLHPELKMDTAIGLTFIDDFKPSLYEWHYIDSLYFCEMEEPFIPLGTLNNRYINFVKKSYGAGTFYLHTNPIVFSNLQMKNPGNFEYASKVFSHLEEGDIYFDIASRIDQDIVDNLNNRDRESNSGERSFENSPFSYVLSQAPLAWAWYTALAVGLLYLLFRAKRKQRIIPVLEANNNTSMDFISTIGRLYFLQNDHKMLSKQKMKLFLAYIRERYNIPTKDIDAHFVQKVASISEVPPDTINSILKKYQDIKEVATIKEEQLIDFHIEMDKFYKNCK